MKHTTYEPSGIEKFFAEINGLLQMGLGLAAFFGFMGLYDEEPLSIVLGVIAGFAVIGGLAVFGNAAMAHANIHKSMVDEDIKALGHNKESSDHLPIPPLRAFLRRSFYAWILFIAAIVLIIVVGGFVTAGISSILRPLGGDSNLLSTLIFMAGLLPIFLTGLGMMLGAALLAGPVVDQKIYRNEMINAHLYKTDENPLALEKIDQGAWQIIKYSLYLSGVLVVIIFLQVGIKLLGRSDLPFIVIIGLMLLIVISVFYLTWRLMRRQSKHQAEEMTDQFMDRFEQDLLEHYGEDSEEVREFRAGQAEYEAMSEEEKQQLEDKHKQEVGQNSERFSVLGQMYRVFFIEQYGEDSEEVREFRAGQAEFEAMSEEEKQQLEDEHMQEVGQNSGRFSVLGQMYRVFFIFSIGGMFVAFFASLGITFVAGRLGVEGDALEAIGSWSFPLLLIVGMFLFVWRMSKMNVELPQELTLMTEATENGEFKAAVKFADIARQTVRLEEFGYVLGLTYLMAGKIEKAEQVTRESVRQIMFQEEYNRNKKLLGQTLTALGVVLLESRRLEEAEKTFKQALQQNKKNAWTLSNLAEVYLFKGKGDIALKYIEQAMKANDQKPEKERTTGANHYLLKAWALTLMGEYADTKALMEEAYRRAGDNKGIQAELHYYSGHVALARGKGTTATLAFQHAIDALPGSMVAIQAERMLNG